MKAIDRIFHQTPLRFPRHHQTRSAVAPAGSREREAINKLVCLYPNPTRSVVVHAVQGMAGEQRLLKGRALGEASAERCSAQKKRSVTLPFLLSCAMNIERFRHPSVPQELLPRTDASASGTVCCQAVGVPLHSKSSWDVARAPPAPAVAVAADSDGGGDCCVGPQALASTRGARPPGRSVTSTAAPTAPPAGLASSASTATWNQEGPILLFPTTEENPKKSGIHEQRPSKRTNMRI